MSKAKLAEYSTTLRRSLIDHALKLLCSFVALVLTTHIWAEESDESEESESIYEMETITVTATRTEDSLLEVPISVTAFSDDDLKHYQITNIKDLEVRTPGLQFGLDSPATIRGIGSLYRGVGGDVAVAQYSNDLYFDEPYGVVSSMYDLERVEVLRGPQGTLYGRNAIAGAINYINKRPEFDYDVGAQGELSSFNGYRLNGFVTGPLGDSIAYRITLETQGSDGNQENISGPDVGGRGDINIAPQLKFKNDRLNLNIRYARFQQESDSELRVPVRYPDTSLEFHPNPIDGSPSEERNTYYMYPRSQPPATAGGDLQNKVDLNNGGTTDVTRDAVSLHLDYEITPNSSFRYILGDSTVSIGLLGQDSDGTSLTGSTEDPYLSSNALRPLQDSVVFANFDVDITTHEFQLTFNTDRTSTLLGAFFLDQDIYNGIDIFNRGSRAANTNTDELLRSIIGLGFADLIGTDMLFFNPENPNVWISPHDGSGQQIDLENRRTVEASAFFGQTSYAIDEKWSMTAGIRFTKDTKNVLQDDLWFATDFDIFELRGDPPDYRLTDPARYNESADPQEEVFEKTTGHVSMDYHANENELYYVRIATGYRSGGISPGAPEPYDRYDDEELTSYEMGYKADLQDGRLRTLVSGFIYDFANYQQPLLIRETQPTPREIFVIANLPNTSLYGVEVESTYFVNPNFNLSGFYAYQISSLGAISAADPLNPNQMYEQVTYVNPINGQTETEFLGTLYDLKGNELPNMPRHKWSINANFRRALANGSELSYTTSYSFTGQRFNRIHNIQYDELEGYGRWDAGLTWTSQSKTTTVTAFVENILNTIGILELESNGWDAGFYQDATLSDPRFFGIVVNWDR